MKKSMKFLLRKVKFQKRVFAQGPVTGLQFTRHWVFAGTVLSTWNRALKTIGTLTFGKQYRVQDIAPDPAWKNKKFGVRIAVGRVLKYLVKLGLLPLIELNPGKGGPRRYARI